MIERVFTEQELLDAFLEGWSRSGEGWNGEWVPEKSDPDTTLKRYFREWVDRTYAYEESPLDNRD